MLIRSWLGTKVLGTAHLHVICQQLLAVGLGQRDLVLDVGALGVAAEVSVADRWVARGVDVCSFGIMSAKFLFSVGK